MSDSALTVMIVEDEQMLREVYTLVLESHGYNVVSAINGLDGLQKLKVSHPRIVLLDIMMPVMDGREFLRNIDLDEYPGTKIIVYSNMSDSAVEDEMYKLGASNFVLKSSMTPDDLIGMIATV